MPLLLLPGIVLVGGPEGVHGAVRAGRGGVERVESGGLGVNSIDIMNFGHRTECKTGPSSGPNSVLGYKYKFRHVSKLQK